MTGARVLFYSNECVGLGHLRRSLILARHVTELDPSASALVVTGSGAAGRYEPSPRVDTVKLPVLARSGDGSHRPKSLSVGVDDVFRLRSRLALAAAETFEPDVAVVDKTPLGLGNELLAVLDALAARPCRVVLGLRDIEDDPDRVRSNWLRAEVRRALERCYDAILVYGPPTPGLDAIDCLGWHDLDIPVHHVGYVASPLAEDAPVDLPGEYLLVTAGGGADGFRLLATFLDAVRLAPLPHPSVLVAGPLLDRSRLGALRERARGLDVEIHQFREDMEAVVVGARAVVSMAGYNTVAEVLEAEKPALLVPRVRPSAEQLSRARMLASRGVASMLHPDELTPARLRAALDELLARGRPRATGEEYQGGPRAAEILVQLAATADERVREAAAL